MLRVVIENTSDYKNNLVVEIFYFRQKTNLFDIAPRERICN